MQFYLSGSRLGTILHSLLYLSGVPIFLNDYEDSIEGSFYNNGIWNASEWEFQNENQLNSTAADLMNETERCYGTLGCFKIRYSDRRGFHLFPESIEDINPTICHYTNNSEQRCEVVETETVERLPIAVGGNNKSYWVTHGYMENGNRPWIKEMVHELLQVDPMGNVFVIDWSQGAKPPYSQAVVNIELVAVYCGNIMTLLQETHGLKISNIHVIGHSLGSHLGGFIGNWLKSNGNTLGRISGLDPAQPHFQDYPEDARLDPSDADFVDVIHTDARPLMDGGTVTGLGTQQPSGHADFFPNNGKDQPGCKEGVYNAILQEDGSFIYGIRRFLGCDHMRAYEYFIESIRSPCQFMGFQCSSWDQFLSISCNTTNTNRMGFHATNPYLSDLFNTDNKEIQPISYFLITSSKPPFCRNHFIVKINLAEKPTHRSNSDLHLVLTSETGTTSTLAVDSSELRGTELTYKYLREGLYKGPITKLIFRPAMSNPLWWFVNRMGPKTPDLTVQSISILHLEHETMENSENKFCPEGSPSFSVADQNPSISLIKSDSC